MSRDAGYHPSRLIGATLCVMAPEAPTRVAGYDLAQIANAAIIADVARSLDLGDRGALLGVMCAMGESSLRNIDYGDWETNGVRNPDGSPTTSVGLFQQQASWGSVADRTDPTYSAWAFYRMLVRVRDWATIEPTRAIHSVQVNADPNHYAKYEQPARAVLAAIPGLRAKGDIVASDFDMIEVPWQRGMYGRRILVNLLERAGRPRINSMHRVYQDQKDAWNAYRARRGNPADNPDDPNSYELGHVRGIAADIDATADNVRRLAAVGLVRPFSYEPWHWRIAGDVRRFPLLFSLNIVAGGDAEPLPKDWLMALSDQQQKELFDRTNQIHTWLDEVQKALLNGREETGWGERAIDTIHRVTLDHHSRIFIRGEDGKPLWDFYQEALPTLRRIEDVTDEEVNRLARAYADEADRRRKLSSPTA